MSHEKYTYIVSDIYYLGKPNVSTTSSINKYIYHYISFCGSERESLNVLACGKISLGFGYVYSSAFYVTSLQPSLRYSSFFFALDESRSPNFVTMEINIRIRIVTVPT